MSDSSPSPHLVGILPARWGSTRFPGKPLHLIAGKPLIQHVWERCSLAKSLQEIYVATDDERILKAVAAFGGKVIMTSPDHETGTDRLAEAATACPKATQLLNIQGDEPLIEPSLIDEIAASLISENAPDMVTAANPIKFEDAAYYDPNVVKVALTLSHRALYFSRSPLPFVREKTTIPTIYRHKGIYGYQRSFLEKFVSWKPSPLEKAESLEQLRALENGASIHIVITDDASPGVDTPEQAAEIERLLSL